MTCLWQSTPAVSSRCRCRINQLHRISSCSSSHDISNDLSDDDCFTMYGTKDSITSANECRNMTQYLSLWHLNDVGRSMIEKSSYSCPIGMTPWTWYPTLSPRYMCTVRGSELGLCRRSLELNSVDWKMIFKCRYQYLRYRTRWQSLDHIDKWIQVKIFFDPMLILADQVSLVVPLI